MKIRMLVAPVLAALLLSAPGCGSPSDPSAHAGTETFTGTVDVGGRAIHNFSVASDGSTVVTLVSLSPQVDTLVGLAFGTPGNTGSCQVFAFLQTAEPGLSLRGNLSAGKYCVEIYDVGNLTGPNAYTLQVAHS
jgi:hypothetical protein